MLITYMQTVMPRVASADQLLTQISVLRTGTVSPSVSVQIAVIKVLIEASRNETVWIKWRIFSASEQRCDVLLTVCLLIGCIVFYWTLSRSAEADKN